MKLTLKAPAKINLGLSILGKLPSNYHEVKTIYTQISLFDLIELEEINENIIEILCNNKEIPVDNTNLVWQSVDLIKQKTGVKTGLRIKLDKHIPVGSGLGGGSSDAAVTLRGLNKLWGLKLDQKELIDLAKKIGADVAYQLVGGVKMEIQGGEKAGEFEDLGSLPKCYVVICVFKDEIASQQAYSKIDYSKINRNDLSGLVGAIKDKSLLEIGKNLHNDFEAWTLEEFPEVGEVKEIMKNSGARGSLMSGKGLTVFGLFEDEKTAKRLYNQLSQRYRQVQLTKPYYD